VSAVPAFLLAAVTMTRTLSCAPQAFLDTDEVRAALNQTNSPLAALSILKKVCDHPALLSSRAARMVTDAGQAGSASPNDARDARDDDWSTSDGESGPSDWEEEDRPGSGVDARDRPAEPRMRAFVEKELLEELRQKGGRRRGLPRACWLLLSRPVPGCLAACVTVFRLADCTGGRCSLCGSQVRGPPARLRSSWRCWRIWCERGTAPWSSASRASCWTCCRWGTCALRGGVPWVGGGGAAE
jgi:hypothetical protein